MWGWDPETSLALICLFYCNSADIISTVEFDSTGNYLATGDKGGRVVLFERNEMVCAFLRIVSFRHPLPVPTVVLVLAFV